MNKSKSYNRVYLNKNYDVKKKTVVFKLPGSNSKENEARKHSYIAHLSKPAFENRYSSNYKTLHFVAHCCNIKFKILNRQRKNLERYIAIALNLSSIHSSSFPVVRNIFRGFHKHDISVIPCGQRDVERTRLDR